MKTRKTQARGTRRADAGFTLLEILIVIALLGMIMTVVVPGIMNQFDEGRIGTTRLNIENLKPVLDRYYIKHHKYPDNLAVLMEPDDKNLGDPWIEDPAQLRDSWDREFVYTATGRKFEIISLGADGLEGGENADADITSDKLKMVGR